MNEWMKKDERTLEPFILFYINQTYFYTLQHELPNATLNLSWNQAGKKYTSK